MKMNKFGWFSIFLTFVLVGILGGLFLVGGFESNTTTPAKPLEKILSYAFMGLLLLWGLSGVVGWIMLMRKGFFADQVYFLAAGNAWLGCLVGIFLLAGLWIIAVLPGPYLVWFASTRIPRLQCPKCKNWLPMSATKCVNCDIPLPGVPQGKPIQTFISETVEEGSLVVKCEKCQAADTPGEKYFFFYGTFLRAEGLSNNRTRYDFKIAGSQDVYLCDRCISEYIRKKTQRISLGVLTGVAVLGVGVPLVQYFSSIKTAGDEGVVFPYFMIVFMIILGIVVLVMLPRKVKKQLLSHGDILAIKLRKPGLKSQGYTRFYTREQMRNNQLL